jgi:hypothetical protein
MNKPTSSLRLVAGASLALCSALTHVAQAAPTQAELDSIVLYGSTTIAKDSTSAWGVWEQIDPPAAGPQLPRIDHVAKAEWYRPMAQVTLNTAPAVAADALCSSGGICGFGVFYDDQAYGGRLLSLAVGNEGSPGPIDSADEHPYVLTATPVTLPPKEVELSTRAEQPAALASSAVIPAAVEILSQALDKGSLLLPNSGTLLLSSGGYEKPVNTEGDPYYEVHADFNNNDYFDPAAVQATWYSGFIGKYVAGSGEAGGRWVEQALYGVAGYTTSQEDMNALRELSRSSHATATYAGYDSKGNSVTPNVILNVKFGDGTFTGSFNGGTDGSKVSVGTSASGPVLSGAVGFNVTSGVITGSEFKSTGLSASDGTVTGTVRGAFFGPMAAAAGGVADVTKTRTDGAYTNARFVSPFLAIKGLSTGTVRGRFDD